MPFDSLLADKHKLSGRGINKLAEPIVCQCESQ